MKESWEYKKLGAVADFYRGLTYKREDEVDLSDNCVLRSNNIDLESMSLNFEELKYIRPDLVIPEEKKLKANSVFVCMSNGSKQHVGKVAYIKDNMDYAFGGFMGLIVPKREIEGKYIYYVCRSSLYRQFLTQIGNGIGITNLRFSDLNNFSLPVPPLSKQQHIVEELDLLSSIIEKKKAQLKELDNLAQSLFYEMFGDPITNDKGWEVKKIGEIAESKIGVTYKPTDVNDNGIIVLRSSNIQNSEIDLEDIVRVNCIIKDEKYVRDGDILMCTRNGSFRLVGKVALINNLPERMTYGAFMTIIRSQYNDFLFMFFQLPAFRQQLATAQTATINQITVKMLNDVKVIVPPLDLQNQFASKIEAIEHQKELIKQSIKEVETLFNSRMDYYFN